MFPAAQQTFGLQTAIRMSATFPYASPAVSLPTKPPRRLVDAGYYDNYGVNLAVAWAYQYHDWIRKNTSGLALIQINAFPRTDPSSAIVPGGAAISESAKHSFEWLTSPIEGAFAARNWSMQYRNDDQLHFLDDTFNGPGDNPLFFDIFVFTNPNSAAMNWIITLEDIREMQLSINGKPTIKNEVGKKVEKKNNDEMARLIRWWNGYPSLLRFQRAIPAPDDFQPFPLPEDFPAYVKREGDRDIILNHPAEGFVKRTLKTVNRYRGEDGGYVAFYTRDSSKGVYSVGGGIYVVGQIRLKGHYVGRIFQPDDFGVDISALPELKELCRQTFGVEGWAGWDTGGWYGIQ